MKAHKSTHASESTEDYMEMMVYASKENLTTMDAKLLITLVFYSECLLQLCFQLEFQEVISIHALPSAI